MHTISISLLTKGQHEDSKINNYYIVIMENIFHLFYFFLDEIDNILCIHTLTDTCFCNKIYPVTVL